MILFEYFTFVWAEGIVNVANQPKRFDKVLNEYGRQGWEVVSVFPNNGSIVATFKRELGIQRT